MLAVERHAKDPQDAVDFLTVSLSAHPDNFNTMTQLAIHEFWRFNVARALQLIERALKIHYAYVPALIVLGEILLFLEQPEKA